MRTRSDLEDLSRKVELALEQCPEEQFGLMQFLVANIPDRDLASLSANFLPHLSLLAPNDETE